MNEPMVHFAVERLSSLLVPPSKPLGCPPDWGSVAESWNVAFPGDYRDFLAVYGAGSIDDYMEIATVLDSSLGFEQGPTVSGLTEVARSLHLENSDWPYPVWPEAGGLICWGVTVDYAVLYWDTANSDPDRWSVVVRDREGEFTRFDFGMAEFVLRMLGPSGERPLSSPRLYGAPKSRFLNRDDEKRIKAAGGDPWEYLEELFEANEEDEYDEDEGLLIVYYSDGGKEEIPGGTPPERHG
ncbi:hypothetical protein [Kitasatospora sp. NPDC048407]|uniref:hypothetical protein n=1 Tax=Kitasatospora sp. NPDC048407 TaxID=3364051 RepID=UPI003715811D